MSMSMNEIQRRSLRPPTGRFTGWRPGLRAARMGGVDVPQPAPDVVPLPPSPHPVPRGPDVPPEIIEPPLPIDNPPVREPIVPGDGDTIRALS